MTHNQAVYYRLLLENGHPEELTKHIDHALETENPLSDLTLDLSLCFSDKEKLLRVLGNHICKVNPSEIDWNGASIFLHDRYVYLADGISRVEEVSASECYFKAKSMLYRVTPE